MLSSPPRRQFLCGYLARVRFVISVKKYRKNTLLLTKNLWFLLPNEIVLQILSIFWVSISFYIFNPLAIEHFVDTLSPSHISFPFCAIIMCVVKGLCKFWETWIGFGICTVARVRFGNTRHSLDIFFSLSIDLSRGFIYLEVRLIM